MVRIIPAILATNEEDYHNNLDKIENSVHLEDGWVHIDFIDGIFAPSITITPEVLKKYPTKLKIEAHLMVANPTEYMKGLEADRIITHIEIPKDKLPDEANLAINPETDLSALDDFNPSVVLVMTVHPGKQGQEFIPQALEKIKALKVKRPDILIGVDGGVSAENAKLIVDAGADYLVVGSHLLEGDIDENLEVFWEALQGSKS